MGCLADMFSVEQRAIWRCWIILAFKWKKASEYLCTNWVFKVECENPQLTGQQNFL